MIPKANAGDTFAGPHAFWLGSARREHHSNWYPSFQAPSPVFAPGDMPLVMTCLARLYTIAYGPKPAGLRFHNPGGRSKEGRSKRQDIGQAPQLPRCVADDYLPRRTRSYLKESFWLGFGTVETADLKHRLENMKLVHEDFRLCR